MSGRFDAISWKSINSACRKTMGFQGKKARDKEERKKVWPNGLLLFSSSAGKSPSTALRRVVIERPLVVVVDADGTHLALRYIRSLSNVCRQGFVVERVFIAYHAQPIVCTMYIKGNRRRRGSAGWDIRVFTPTESNTYIAYATQGRTTVAASVFQSSGRSDGCLVFFYKAFLLVERACIIRRGPVLFSWCISADSAPAYYIVYIITSAVSTVLDSIGLCICRSLSLSLSVRQLL